MNLRRQQLAREREELVARSDAQRTELSIYSQRLEGPVQIVARTLSLANTLRRSPLAITALAAVLWRTPWRRLAHTPKRVWWAWKIFQFVRGWVT